MKCFKLVSWLVGISLVFAGQTPNSYALEAPTLDVISPDGGEVWQVGSAQTISWINGGFTLVDIAYTTTGSEDGPWTTIATDVDAETSYDWVIPNTPTNTALIRLYGHFAGGMGPEGYFYGADTFNIVNVVPAAKSVTIVSPNGGERWRIGSLQSIHWTTQGIPSEDMMQVDISRKDGKWKTIGIMPNTGVMYWRVSGPKTDTALIRVSLVSDVSAQDVSDSHFSIVTR